MSERFLVICRQQGISADRPQKGSFQLARYISRAGRIEIVPYHHHIPLSGCQTCAASPNPVSDNLIDATRVEFAAAILWRCDILDRHTASEHKELETLDEDRGRVLERPSESKTRKCLLCRDGFPSAWAGERICRRCKSSSTWRSGVLK